MDAGPLSALAQRRGEGQVLSKIANRGFLGLVDELARDARVLGWSEGIHNRTEYLAARNAVIRRLVEDDRIRVIAAETNFALSRATDSYICGEGTGRVPRAAVCGVWSWWRLPLQENLSLVTWLRQHNATRPPDRRVRFYGLDTYGGDHRDVAARDAAQYTTLEEVARRHPQEPILLFEQVEHLDPAIPGSLGEHLARGRLGPVRSVAALWREGDPSVRYPLGPYLPLARWLEHNRGLLVDGPAGTGILDLRTGSTATAAEPDPVIAEAAQRFDAVLYAPRLTAAATAEL